MIKNTLVISYPSVVAVCGVIVKANNDIKAWKIHNFFKKHTFLFWSY